MKNWLKLILKALPVEDILDAFIDWLAEKAKQTENTLDDRAVEIIRVILRNAFA